MTPEPGHIVGGKYRLEKPLAKGGMGSVWLARHTELDAPVAVKFMAHELVGTPVAEMRFKREAKAAAQLRSPHVVQIHDYGIHDGAPYMVMELLDGEDLSTELDRVGRLPIGRVATIALQVAKALALAHAAGIVHRDLKPANLFLARSGDDETVKVLDFGVAKETATSLVVDKTTSGTLVGSPQYMSPEQARGEHVDFQSDLWSLGVVVFEALTGRPPFESTHLGALLAKIHEANAPLPTSIAPDLPAAVDAFMKRALARSPADRFPSAKAMADELAAIAGATPKEAPRTITIVPAGQDRLARSVVGRAIDTMPANESDPVSTTMHEPAVSAPADGRGPRRSLVAAGIAAALGIALVAGWLAFGNGGAGGAATAGNEPSARAASSDTTTSSAAPPEVRPSGAIPVSTERAPQAGAASVAGTTTAGSPSTGGSTTSAASPPSSVRPAFTPPTPPIAIPSKTAAPVTTATRTSAPTATATATAPAFDPTFGLPAGDP
jgi:serine/threonine protein kinase